MLAVAEAVDDEDVARAQGGDDVVKSVESFPGSASVMAVPAMRVSPPRSDWIAGSMKPSWRRWPTVAVSTRASLARSPSGIGAGMSLIT